MPERGYTKPAGGEIWRTAAGRASTFGNSASGPVCPPRSRGAAWREQWGGRPRRRVCPGHLPPGVSRASQLELEHIEAAHDPVHRVDDPALVDEYINVRFAPERSSMMRTCPCFLDPAGRKILCRGGSARGRRSSLSRRSPRPARGSSTRKCSGSSSRGGSRKREKVATPIGMSGHCRIGLSIPLTPKIIYVR